MTAYCPLHPSQRGFVAGKSIVTNCLCCESIIAACISERHPYDVITIDLQKAFDKLPHYSILSALVARVVHGTALAWFCSFLSNRNQRVYVSASLSEPIAVTSGSIQRSSLGLILSLSCLIHYFTNYVHRHSHLQMILNLLSICSSEARL